MEKKSMVPVVANKDESVQPSWFMPQPPAEAGIPEKLQFYLENVIPKPEKPYYGFGLGDNLSPKTLNKVKANLGKKFPRNEKIIFAIGYGNMAILCTERALYLTSKNNPPREIEYHAISSLYLRLPTSIPGVIQLYINEDCMETHYIGLSTPVNTMTSCLQRAIGKEPHTRFEEIRAIFEKSFSPKGRLISTLWPIIFWAFLISAIILPFFNPRLLAPVGLGLVAFGHSASRNWGPITVLGDIIVWVVLTVMMFQWVLDGF